MQKYQNNFFLNHPEMYMFSHNEILKKEISNHIILVTETQMFQIFWQFPWYHKAKMLSIVVN